MACWTNDAAKRVAVLPRALRALALVAGAALLALMLLTVADVVLRYAFAAPFRGSIELTEFAMALIVFFGLGWCGWTGGHVAVDLFGKWLDRPAMFWLPALIDLAGGLLFALVAWRTLLYGLGRMGSHSNLMQLPHWPFLFAAALGSAMLALVLFAGAWRAARGPR